MTPLDASPRGPLVLKLGGELIETAEARDRIARAVQAMARTRPVLVVHGGGRAIDAELDRRGVAPKKVDGLRITDEETLDAVVAVLAGSANTALVAALTGCDVRAVGLTGVDAGSARASRVAPLHSTSGAIVDLGLVGDPSDANPTLFELLMTHGYVPVVASLSSDGSQVLNVNADVMACRIAAALGADLVIAGATPGVLDGGGRTIAALSPAEAQAMVASGAANAGMVAKLNACMTAIDDGVPAIRIVDGRRLDAGVEADELPGTTIAPAAAGVHA